LEPLVLVFVTHTDKVPTASGAKDALTIGQVGQTRAEVIRAMLTFAATYMDDHGRLRLQRRAGRPQPKPSDGGRG